MSRKTKLKTKPRVTVKVTPETDPAEAASRLFECLSFEPKKPPTEKEIKAEDAAFELLLKSDRYVVGTTEQVDQVRRMDRADARLQGFIAGIKAPRTQGEARVKAEAPALAMVLQEVFTEAKKAIQKHGPMHSPHEGLGVIMEEFDELKDEIYADRGKQLSARTEALQLAAMAVRYVLNVNPR